MFFQISIILFRRRVYRIIVHIIDAILSIKNSFLVAPHRRVSCLFCLLCLLQIQVGVQRRSEFMVNLGVAFVALDIIATYISLFGSMARTGVMFLVGGVFLILFGVYLEKKRRALMRQMKAAAI